MSSTDVLLSSVAKVFNGKTPSRDEQRAKGHPVLKIRDIDELGAFRGRFDSYVDHELASKFSSRFVQAGDTLILNAAHSATHVASKTCFATEEFAGSLATGEWLIIRPDHLSVDPRFVNHWINWSRTRQHLRDMVNGIHLYPKDVERLAIPKLERKEQERIAAILDKADLIRRKRQQALRLADDFLRSVFLDMFGEPGRHGWEMLTVTDMLAPRDGAIRTGPFGSQLLHSEFVDEGIAVLGIDNAVSNEFRWGKPRFITEDKYEEMKRYTVRPGDVIITIMGTVGRCAIVPEDIPIAINTKHLCCITLDHQKCLPEFLHAYFLTHPVARKYLASTAKGAIMDGLNMGIIKAMPVPQVPLHLQEEYREVVRKHHQMKTRLTAHQAEAERLFSSLQQRAFSGQF